MPRKLGFAFTIHSSDIHVEKNEPNFPDDLKAKRFLGDRTVMISRDERVPVSLVASML